MNKTFIALLILAIGFGIGLLAGGSFQNRAAPSPNQESSGQATRSSDNPFERIPVINAYHEGKEIWFIHTDVSDEQMAALLTKMVNYSVIYSPQLGDADRSKAGKLYVFLNGVRQDGVKPWNGGPFGYQIDIFDSIPGDPDYTPLHNPQFVTWDEKATPRILTSVDELLQAERDGELTIKPTDAIANTPILQ